MHSSVCWPTSMDCIVNVPLSSIYSAGETCNAITRISWLNTDSNPLLVFTGGLPSAEADEHNTITVFQGTEHTALDFGSRIIDFATLNGE